MERYDDSTFDSLVTEAVAQHRARQFDAAETGYRAALGLSPGHPAVMHNLGVLAAARGDLRTALDHFDAVIAREPRYVPAHFNRAVALGDLGKTRDAVDAFRRVVALDPDHYEAHRALAFLWLAQRDRGRALDHFARTYELRRGDDRTGRASRSLTWSSRTKLVHDADQFRYLAARSRDGQGFGTLADLYARVAPRAPDAPSPLSDEQLEEFGGTYNTAIHLADAPELTGGTINERLDADAIMEGFARAGGAVAFDELLKPGALAGLRTYLLESTIWHDFSHIDGFVAAYLEDGLACPLLLQIADELRDVFGALLGARPLTQAWAFKAVSPGAGIESHADGAAISVNFWLTPDQANLSPGRGGMIVCTKPPPDDWEIEGYAGDRTRAQAFMAANADAALRVPYRENRATLFRSRLLHGSDAPQFAAGYGNHRINMSLLFGTAEKAPAGAVPQGVA
jgi:tetratricopeptide (TPR) repeat protein